MTQSRKNKTNQCIVWPKKAYFIIDDIFAENPSVIHISTRVKLSKAIEEGKVAEIGVVPGGKGRPKKVYALTPVTKTLLNKADQDGISLVDNADKLVHVVTVSSVPSQSTVTPIIQHSTLMK